MCKLEKRKGRDGVVDVGFDGEDGYIVWRGIRTCYTAWAICSVFEGEEEIKFVQCAGSSFRFYGCGGISRWAFSAESSAEYNQYRCEKEAIALALCIGEGCTRRGTRKVKVFYQSISISRSCFPCTPAGVPLHMSQIIRYIEASGDIFCLVVPLFFA
jgi:hypothetical protein